MGFSGGTVMGIRTWHCFFSLHFAEPLSNVSRWHKLAPRWPKITKLPGTARFLDPFLGHFGAPSCPILPHLVPSYAAQIPPCYGDSHLALYFFVALLRTIVQCLKMAQVGSKMAQNHETAWHGQIFGPIFGPLWRPILPHLASSCPILRSPNPTLLWGFALGTVFFRCTSPNHRPMSQDGTSWLQDGPKSRNCLARTDFWTHFWATLAPHLASSCLILSHLTQPKSHPAMGIRTWHCIFSLPA